MERERTREIRLGLFRELRETINGLCYVMVRDSESSDPWIEVGVIDGETSGVPTKYEELRVVVVPSERAIQASARNDSIVPLLGKHFSEEDKEFIRRAGEYSDRHDHGKTPDYL